MKLNSLSIIILVVITVAIVLSSGGCSSSQSQNLKIVNHSMTVQKFSNDTVQGLAVVSGQALNTGTIAVAEATITVEFYDKDGKPLNTSSTVSENLQPNTPWNFGVQFMGPDAWKVSTYKISGSTR